MLAISLLILAMLVISTASAGARLEGRVLADIEQGRYESTPGTAKLVAQLRAEGVVRDVDGRLTVDPDARAARTARGRQRVTRTAVIAISVAGLVAVATKLLLDRQGQ